MCKEQSYLLVAHCVLFGTRWSRYNKIQQAGFNTPCRLKIISRYLVQNCVMSYCASLLRMCLVSCFVSRARMFKVAGNGAGNARSSAERSNLLFEVRYEEMKTLENLFDIFWMPCSKLVKAGQLIIMGCLPFPAVAF